MDKMQLALAVMTILFITVTLACVLLNRENKQMQEIMKDLLDENIKIIRQLNINRNSAEKKEDGNN